MALADTLYVRERDGTLYIGATEVMAYNLIAAWRNEGYSAEELQFGFPALSLAQVYGTIAYYLDHQQELDARFAVEDQEYYRQREQDRKSDPDFYRRLDERRALLRQRLASAESHLEGNGPGTANAQEPHGDN